MAFYQERALEKNFKNQYTTAKRQLLCSIIITYGNFFRMYI